MQGDLTKPVDKIEKLLVIANKGAQVFDLVKDSDNKHLQEVAKYAMIASAESLGEVLGLIERDEEAKTKYSPNIDEIRAAYLYAEKERRRYNGQII